MSGVQLSVKIGFITYGPAPEVVVDAIRSIQVTQKAGQRSGFQIALAMEKGGEIERELLPSGFFAPGKRIILSLITNGVRE